MTGADRARERFEQLHGSGANVLLVESGAGNVACDRLRGDDARELHVVTAGTDWRSRVPQTRDPDHLGVVELSGTTARSSPTAGAGSSATRSAPDARPAPGSELPDSVPPESDADGGVREAGLRPAQPGTGQVGPNASGRKGIGPTGGGTIAPSNPAAATVGVGSVSVAANAPPRSDVEWYSRCHLADGLSTVARHVAAHLSRLSAGTPGAEESPAGLGAGKGSAPDVRLCIDGIDPLLDRFGATAVSRFCGVVGARVNLADALAHYHVSAALEEELGSWTRPVFDAAMEVRRRNGESQQRWQFFRPELRTEWFRLEE